MKLVDKIQFLNTEITQLKSVIKSLEFLQSRNESERIDDAIMWAGVALEKLEVERSELKKGLDV